MSIDVDGYMPGPWKFYKGVSGAYFMQGAAGNPSGCFEVVLIVNDIRQADAVLIESAPDLLEALAEIKRHCEPWRKADDLAGKLCDIAAAAIKKATTIRPIGYYED